MQRSFAATIGMIAIFVVFCVLVAVNIVQVNRLEGGVIETRRAIETLEGTISRLQNQLETGDIAIRGGGQDRSGASTGDGDIDYHQRYYAPEEWQALNAPGNMLQPRTDRFRVEGAEEGGTLRRAFINDIPGLNFLTQNAADVTELQSYVHESLASQQRNDPDRWIPGLAYRVEVNEDHTEYRVFLKRGVMWHPPAVDLTNERYAWLRGDREVVADDFVFFMELVQNPQVEAAHLRNYYEDFEGIEVVNDHEFIVRWKEPRFQSISFTLGMYPLPRWLFGHDETGQPYPDTEVGRRFNDHWYNQKAIGTGPYRFVTWEQGGAIVLERNSRYHGERPPIERIEFQIVRDPTTMLNMLKAGELDFIPLQPTQYANEIVDGGTLGFASGELEHEVYQGTSYRYLGWNADGRFFGDRRVRTAMTHAFNREMILRANFHDLGRIITGNFFIDGPDYNRALEPLPFDLDRAAQLLDEAGWQDNNGDGIREKVIDGQLVNFQFGMLTYGYRPEFVAAMEAYRNDLRRIGVVMNIEPVEWAVMVERMLEKDFDAYTGGWVLGWESDPYQIWHSSQADTPRSSNRIGFRNPEADAIIEEARRTFDPEERSALFHRFHEIIHREQPYTFFFAGKEVAAWRSHVENVNFSPLRPFDQSLNWYLAP